MKENSIYIKPKKKKETRVPSGAGRYIHIYIYTVHIYPPDHPPSIVHRALW